MTAYLLAWNPKRWQWNDLPEIADRNKGGSVFNRRWSCGNSKRIKIGDRIFLIRLGESPKGIFASGEVIKEPFLDTHWEGPATGKQALFIEVQFDTLKDPEKDEILTLAVLQQPPFSEMKWITRMSGVKIPDKVAAELEVAWINLSVNHYIAADEIETTFWEGASKSVWVNAYERNPIARQKCIVYYGAICSVCGINFEKVYGEIGKGFIHVHHLIAISEIGQEYTVDPIKDLRPVCPNCHAMLHRKKPPLSTDELAVIINEKKKNA